MAIDRLRVLIVEDEAIIAMDLEDAFEAEGHVVVGSAMTSHEAIALFERLRPHLSVIDVELMEGTTGIEVADHIARSGQSDFVFITATPKRLEGDFHGGIGVISKPFTASQIVRSVHYLHEGIGDPPPNLECPASLILSPGYCAQWAQ